jgi:hypothetical protein
MTNTGCSIDGYPTAAAGRFGGSVGNPLTHAAAGLILWTLQTPNGKGNKGLIQTFSFANSGRNAQ